MSAAVEGVIRGTIPCRCLWNSPLGQFYEDDCEEEAGAFGVGLEQVGGGIMLPASY